MHPDDSTRILQPSSLPTSNDQGGGTDGGGGGINCVLADRLVERYDPATGLGKKDKAANFKDGDLVYYGRKGVPNRIKRVRIEIAYSYYEVRIGAKRYTEVTGSHRFVTDNLNLRKGTRLYEIERGSNILPSLENCGILEPIDKRFVSCPNGIRVVTFIMEEDISRPDECCLLIVDDTLSHNNKLPDIFL